ncbi:MAG TPA: L-threonylcarbamoyladenylate synthase [Bacteroidales bacterium]|nr:L-threonylcarbamoyladenylate synthase [Bacteroidales bacterium]
MEEEIRKSLAVLEKGGTLLYPTDTVWGIGCDATNEKAVDKIYRIKKRMENKSLIVLLDDTSRLQDYVGTVPDIAWDLMRKVHRPLTIIYPNARNIAKNVIGKDGSLAIRISGNDFCKSLIRKLGKPIVSTSANISGEDPPLTFNKISQDILGQVDYVVNLYQDVVRQFRPSQIIKLNENGEFKIIRS